MVFKLIEAAQDRWQAANAPHLVALVRAGATFIIPGLCVFSLLLNGFGVSSAPTIKVTLSYPELARNGSLGSVDTLGFEDREERLGHRVIVADSSPSDGLSHVEIT